MVITTTPTDAGELRNLVPLDSALFGDPGALFDNIAEYESATPTSLVWISGKIVNHTEWVLNSPAAVVVTQPASVYSEQELQSRAVIVTSDPRAFIISAITALSVTRNAPKGISSMARICRTAIIDENVTIGDFSVLGNCSVGSGCIIGSHVVLDEGVTLGRNVIIEAHSTVGAQGSGFLLKDGEIWEEFPQVGFVIVEDDVRIGSYSCIARGAIGATRIGRGTKIDSSVEVAHGVKIGQFCKVSAGSHIGAYAELGDRIWIAPGSNIKDRVQIGNDAFIGTGSVVIRNVGAAEKWFGNPARKIGSA